MSRLRENLVGDILHRNYQGSLIPIVRAHICVWSRNKHDVQTSVIDFGRQSAQNYLIAQNDTSLAASTNSCHNTPLSRGLELDSRLVLYEALKLAIKALIVQDVSVESG